MMTQARADARALVGAAAVGATLGVLIGGAFLAGDKAREAHDQTQAQRFQIAAAQQFSDYAFRADALPTKTAVFQRPAQGLQTAAWRGADWNLNAPARNPLLIKASFNDDARSSPPPAPAFHADTANTAKDLDCLTAAVYYEARGENSAGQAAVAQVVLNRVRHPSFPKSVCGVVFQGCQFSFACNGAMHRGHEMGAWNRARDVASRALSGYVYAPVGAATHFHAGYVAPGWGGLIKVAQVGLHVFYKFGGRRGAATLFQPAPEVHAAVLTAQNQTTAADAPRTGLILASAVTTQAPPAVKASDTPAPAPAPTSAPSTPATR